MTESPCVEQGSTRGALDRIRQFRPDCSIVLRGPVGIQVCGPENRPNWWNMVTQRFDSYVVVSRRRIPVIRTETMASRDPRFDIDLNIEMSVSVNDPGEFVRQYGTEGSVIAPFYLGLKSDLRERVRSKVAAEINILNEDLQAVSRKVCENGASHGPVTIHAMDIHAQISQRAMDIFQAMSIHDIAAEHGDAFLLALITQTADESRKRAYVDYYNERRQKEREDEAARREARDDFANFIERIFGDDPKMRNKMLTDEEFLQSMKTAFAQRKRALIANRPVNESLIPADTKPRQLLRAPEMPQS